MKIEIINQIEASMKIKSDMLRDDEIIAKIENLSKACLKSIRLVNKIIFAGNGGSFGDAQHLSAEFTSRFMFDRPPLASIVLGANSSAISAIGNDYGFDQIFARELLGIAKAGDVFIPISTSAKSPNILMAVNKAKQIGLNTTALTGQSGGELNEVCNCIRVPSKETARIQECHILIGHIICGNVEKNYFEKY